MASNLALVSLSITLGVLFVVLGTMQLTPAISSDVHKEVKAQFKRARTVFPFAKTLGWKPKTSEYRKAVGTTHLVCGLLLIFIPGPLKTLANVVLLALMSLAIYSSWALEEDLKHFTGPLVFALLLACRLVIQFQSAGTRVNTRDKHE
ncbi:novel acetylcholine receptor chaperone-like [Watersipora subatra]|uniref:novel acetylcholine receptor chaperone-like n=1 Tax=Watersipora subatra TaxID=2589382 RepID=UPI00355B74A6